MRKFVTVITIIILVKLTISCGRCKYQEPTPFNYNTISVSARSLWHSNVDYDTISVEEVFKNKISLNITLEDSTKMNNYYSELINSLRGFESINATEPCMQSFKSNQSIEKISVFTIEDFNDSISAGADMTNHFLIQTDEPIYQKTENVKLSFNKNIYGSASVTIQLVCDLPARRKTGRFAIEILLSDNRKLKTETLPIIFVDGDEN